MDPHYCNSFNCHYDYILNPDGDIALELYETINVPRLDHPHSGHMHTEQVRHLVLAKSTKLSRRSEYFRKFLEHEQGFVPRSHSASHPYKISLPGKYGHHVVVILLIAQEGRSERIDMALNENMTFKQLMEMALLIDVLELGQNIFIRGYGNQWLRNMMKQKDITTKPLRCPSTKGLEELWNWLHISMVFGKFSHFQIARLFIICLSTGTIPTGHVSLSSAWATGMWKFLKLYSKS